MKKQWTQPQLVILTRNKPEEQVLLACKGWAPGGPDQWWDSCESGGIPCDPCMTSSTS